MHIHHGRVENVSNNGAGSGHIAGSTALEHHLLTGVAMEIDRVKGAVHRGQGMILRQESGMHPHLNGVAIPLGNGQELEHITHFLAAGNVHGRNPRDAFAVHRLKGYPGMEGQGGHDGQLVGGIQSFHVAGRVRLRQAQLLRVLQHGVIALALGGHAAENVVGGAVDNAHELGNAVGLERVHQRIDDGNRTANAGFIV